MGLTWFDRCVTTLSTRWLRGGPMLSMTPKLCLQAARSCVITFPIQSNLSLKLAVVKCVKSSVCNISTCRWICQIRIYVGSLLNISPHAMRWSFWSNIYEAHAIVRCEHSLNSVRICRGDWTFVYKTCWTDRNKHYYDQTNSILKQSFTKWLGFSMLRLRHYKSCSIFPNSLDEFPIIHSQWNWHITQTTPTPA